MTTVSRPKVDAQLTADVADFLFHEASLIDERSFEAWLELYAEDATYSVPIDAEPDPSRRVAIMFEDKRRLVERVLRLNSGFAYSQEPASRTVHVLGNVRVLGETDGLLDVAANMVIVEVRRGKQNLYGAELAYQLRRGDEDFLIVRKDIRLVNSELPLGNITFML